jgi:hypothetical protein
VAGLELETAHRLLAVMYLGRGDQPDFETMVESLRRTAPVDRRAVGRQMIGKAPLVDYLRKGLAKLRRGSLSAVEVEHEQS